MSKPDNKKLVADPYDNFKKSAERCNKECDSAIKSCDRILDNLDKLQEAFKKFEPILVKAFKSYKKVEKSEKEKRILINGKTEYEMPDYREKKENGMQKSYVVLTKEERDKGFVRPVTEEYRHKTCGSKSRMALSIAETYARNPKFYGANYCCNCRDHFPVSEFVWLDDDPNGPSTKEDRVMGT